MGKVGADEEIGLVVAKIGARLQAVVVSQAEDRRRNDEAHQELREHIDAGLSAGRDKTAEHSTKLDTMLITLTKIEVHMARNQEATDSSVDRNRETRKITLVLITLVISTFLSLCGLAVSLLSLSGG